MKGITARRMSLARELVNMCRSALCLISIDDVLKASLEKDPILFPPGSVQRGAKVIPPRPNGKPRVKRGVVNIRLNPEQKLRVDRAAAYRPCLGRLWKKAEEVQGECKCRCPAPPARPRRSGEFVTAVKRLHDWAVHIRWEERRRGRTASPQAKEEPSMSPVLRHLGRRTYQVGTDATFLLTDRENDVISAFIGENTMDEPTLRKRSRREDAARILRHLKRTKKINGMVGYLAAHIHCPGAKSAEGYRVQIEAL